MADLTKPMLAKDAKIVASEAAKIPDGDTDWVMEPKFDGMRFLWFVADDGVKALGGRNGEDHSHDPGLESLREQMAALPPGTVLDSEVIVENGDVGLVGSALCGNLPDRPLQAWVFDVLAAEGEVLTTQPFDTRRARLEQLSTGFGDDVYLVPSVKPSQAVHDAWVASGMEGSMCKHRRSVYRPGSRSSQWLKYKPQQTTEAVVIGYGMGEGQENQHLVGKLEIRLIETDKETSTGYECTPEEAEAMIGKMLTIRHHGFQRSGKVQHPVFDCWRPDRDEVPVVAGARS
jgi:bifunctional non-homologous end joining protein LigD